jgi:hypothetical protein
MKKAEEFLDKHCLWINKRHWKSGEKEQKLYQIGAKTLEQYAQQITKEKDLEIEVLNQALKKIAGI